MGNGCGASDSWFKPPHNIMFKASCDKHDDLYEKGGNYIDRKIADIYLYEYMKLDVKQLCIFKKPYYYVWCMFYYIGVRVGGKKHFNFK